jgi:TPR repeat protein
MKPSAAKKDLQGHCPQDVSTWLQITFETKEKRKKWNDIFPLWYSAATNGHVRAQFYLATCYDHGRGTKKLKSFSSASLKSLRADSLRCPTFLLFFSRM